MDRILPPREDRPVTFDPRLPLIPANRKLIVLVEGNSYRVALRDLLVQLFPFLGELFHSLSPLLRVGAFRPKCCLQRLRLPFTLSFVDWRGNTGLESTPIENGPGRNALGQAGNDRKTPAFGM
jgi:hypothetical protein